MVQPEGIPVLLVLAWQAFVRNRKGKGTPPQLMRGKRYEGR
jgi:hypothetical protein